jgi:uncharacterized membrane protein YkvA (DUF1232 family)
MKGFTQEQVALALDAKAKHLGVEDIERIVANREAVLVMANDFPENWAKAKRQATILFEVLALSAAKKISASLEEKKQAAGALIYLGAPLDLVPDDAEDGYADDAAIVSLAVARAEAAVRAACQVLGLNPAEHLD